MNEDLLQELLASLLPERERDFPLAEDTGLAQESPALAPTELPNPKQEAEPLCPRMPISEEGDGAAHSLKLSGSAPPDRD